MDLKVQKREKFGKIVKDLREKGLVPAEVYGRGFENQHVVVTSKEFGRVFKEAGENTVIDLVLGSEKWPSLIYDIQRDGISGDISHIDFYRVNMTEKIKARIPLEFIGEAPAVKDKIGTLNRVMNDIEVEALPADLPHKIEVDLGVLVDLDKNIYAKDLKVSPLVKIMLEPEAVVATVVPLQKEEEVKPEAVVDVSQVKVESEEKKSERETKKEQEKSQ